MITQFLRFLMRYSCMGFLNRSNKMKRLRTAKKAAFSAAFHVIRVKYLDLFFLAAALLQHGHVVTMERAIVQLPGNPYMMAFMALQCVLIVHIDYALVFF